VGCGRDMPQLRQIMEGIFFKKLILLINILILTILKNILHQVALLVAPVGLVRPNNVVASHVFFYKGSTCVGVARYDTFDGVFDVEKLVVLLPLA
jgi:hypothetical protein